MRVEFRDYYSAERAVAEMAEIITRFGRASVGDLQQLLGIPSSSRYVDEKLGWTNLDNVSVQKTYTGYKVEFPEPEQPAKITMLDVPYKRPDNLFDQLNKEINNGIQDAYKEGIKSAFQACIALAHDAGGMVSEQGLIDLHKTYELIIKKEISNEL